jgi:SsrA-binding protein
MHIMKILASNKRGRYDYAITSTLLAGISLLGPEVKSMKAGQTSLKGSFVNLVDGEAFLVGAHVSPYPPAQQDSQPEPTRPRKLLLHRRELDRLMAERQAGFSIIPLAVGLERNHIKVELGIGRGKKRYDKRQSIKSREVDREIKRRFKA